MYNQNKILLRLYFPQFSSPPLSRFESFFEDLSKNEENKSNIISYEIFPERIVQGEDKRTSLIIKNIPKNIKKREIRNLIEKYGNINFLGITKDQQTDNFIVAFLNVINYKSIVPIFMGLRKHTYKYNNKDINIEIFYSEIQGKDNLKKIFNNDHYDNK